MHEKDMDKPNSMPQLRCDDCVGQERHATWKLVSKVDYDLGMPMKTKSSYTAIATNDDAATFLPCGVGNDAGSGSSGCSGSGVSNNNHNVKASDITTATATATATTSTDRSDDGRTDITITTTTSDAFRTDITTTFTNDNGRNADGRTKITTTATATTNDDVRTDITTTATAKTDRSDKLRTDIATTATANRKDDCRTDVIATATTTNTDRDDVRTDITTTGTTNTDRNGACRTDIATDNDHNDDGRTGINSNDKSNGNDAASIKASSSGSGSEKKNSNTASETNTTNDDTTTNARSDTNSSSATTTEMRTNIIDIESGNNDNAITILDNHKPETMNHTKDNSNTTDNTSDSHNHCDDNDDNCDIDDGRDSPLGEMLSSAPKPFSAHPSECEHDLDDDVKDGFCYTAEGATRVCEITPPSTVPRRWAPEENELVLQMHQEVGEQWSLIALRLNTGRTANATRLHWIKILNPKMKTRSESESKLTSKLKSKSKLLLSSTPTVSRPNPPFLSPHSRKAQPFELTTRQRTETFLGLPVSISTSKQGKQTHYSKLQLELRNGNTRVVGIGDLVELESPKYCHDNFIAKVTGMWESESSDVCSSRKYISGTWYWSNPID
jgi:hypothetical protein